ncbi:hypothetical protein H2201_005145 [Coniosporium apollinis]|uniref:J domain-containing protein n=1 Tax=Coniosporium apollinis TaxID=61459 RepID=A0ABQ9NSU1_9PEZI|nr:hypothetical protein H2201_005145 [Coniosporium apollinis]
MTSTSPYQVLGVSQDAHDHGIKSAYRKQSLLNHPDKNPKDAVAATERMKNVNKAYEMLKPENRAATDEAFGKTSDLRAQAAEHHHQSPRSSPAQAAGSQRPGQDFWSGHRYYARHRREGQQEEAKRERERKARAWQEANEHAERDQRQQQAREQKRQREQEKIKRFWEEGRERREREVREREERLRREEEEETARKRQEEADRARESQEQLQRDIAAMAEQEHQRERAAEEETRKHLEESYQREVQRELARQRWQREQMQSAQFLELYQRHGVVYNEWLQLEAAYNNLLPLVRLDLSGPDPLARYIAWSILDTQDGLCMEAHPYRTEWITRIDYFNQAWPVIFSRGKSGLDIGPLLEDAKIVIEQLDDYTRKLLTIFQILKQEDIDTRRRHNHPRKQRKRCHYFATEAANIAIAKAMHRDVRRRIEVFNLSTWDKRVVKEVAREWASEFQVGKCKAQRSRSRSCLVLTRQLEVQLVTVLQRQIGWKEA